jgi:hypothetical protein
VFQEGMLGPTLSPIKVPSTLAGACRCSDSSCHVVLQEITLSSLNAALVDWESLGRQLTSALAKLQLLDSFGSEAARHASEHGSWE